MLLVSMARARTFVSYLQVLPPLTRAAFARRPVVWGSPVAIRRFSPARAAGRGSIIAHPTTAPTTNIDQTQWVIAQLEVSTNKLTGRRGFGFSLLPPLSRHQHYLVITLCFEPVVSAGLAYARPDESYEPANHRPAEEEIDQCDAAGSAIVALERDNRGHEVAADQSDDRDHSR